MKLFKCAGGPLTNTNSYPLTRRDMRNLHFRSAVVGIAACSFCTKHQEQVWTRSEFAKQSQKGQTWSGKIKWDWIYAKERIRLIHLWEKQENKIWESEHSAIDSDGHKSQVQFSASTVLSLFALHVFHGADWSSFCSPGVSGICKASFCCGDPCSGAGAVIRKPIDVTSQSIQYKSIWIHNQKLT